ncbi:hypothetical protein ACFL7D_02035 [candidate division KSB1 bacterium]
MNNWREIFILPWLELEESIVIGSIHFSPFSNVQDDLKSSEDIMSLLSQSFLSARSDRMFLLNNITICTHGELNFRKLTSLEVLDIRRAVDILILNYICFNIRSKVCYTGTYDNFPNTNLFEMINIHNSGKDRIVHVLDFETSSTFSSLSKGEFRCYKPSTVRLGIRSYFPTLTEGFGQCLVQKNRFTDRLFQSLEWFRIAHLEDFGFSPYAKLVMMHSAFEVFLKFPGLQHKKKGKKTKKRVTKEAYFIKYIENNIASKSFRKVPGIKPNKSEITTAGRWTLRFNRLRNKIVHGDKLIPDSLKYKNNISHLEVADLILIECIVKELFRRGYFNKLIYETNYTVSKPKRINNLAKSIFKHLFTDFKDVHKALGWTK